MSQSKITVELRVTSSTQSTFDSTSAPDTADVTKDPRICVRLVSEWLDCCMTTAVFGDTSLPWVDSSPSNGDSNDTETPNADDINMRESLKTATYTTTFDTNWDESRAKLQRFNVNPMITAVLMEIPSSSAGDSNNNDIPVPLTFAMADCSSFAVDSAGEVKARTQSIDGVFLELIVRTDYAFISPDDCIVLEPLLLDIQRLGGFPVLPGETSRDALDSTYIYGSLNFGGFQRTVFARPSLGWTDTLMSTQRSMSQYEDEIVNIGVKVCMLPGLSDLDHFKESLKSSTFVLQLHREDVHKRAFHERNREEYVRMIVGDSSHAEAEAAAAAAAAAAAPPAKGKAPPPAAATTSSTGPTTPSAMTTLDEFLLRCINNALQTSGQIRCHGSIQFRLEDLLSSSVDLLQEFSRLRQVERGDGNLHQDDKVVVKEDMLVEVRLAKPSKPPRWGKPSDLSLRKALERAAIEEQSKLDGTLAVTASSTTLASSKTNNNNKGLGNTMGATSASMYQRGSIKYDPAATQASQLLARPRHEQFNEWGTRIIMAAELHRKLHHPEEPPLVLRSPPKELQAGQPAVPRPEVDEALWKMLSITPFTRMIFLFKYDDDETLLAIQAAMSKVNLKALPNIQGSLRSYSYTDEELQGCVRGTLDVISGFTVIDDDLRMVVVEGLAGPGQGMQSMFMDLPRTKANDKDLKILCNPEVLFPHRLWGEFGPDLKRIRMRDRLKKLARRPELYNRKQVEEMCFSAIDSLMSLRRAVDLLSTKVYQMYPSAAALSKVELLYGDAISLADLDGIAASKKPKKKTSDNNKLNQSSSTTEGGSQGTQSQSNGNGNGNSGVLSTTQSGAGLGGTGAGAVSTGVSGTQSMTAADAKSTQHSSPGKSKGSKAGAGADDKNNDAPVNPRLLPTDSRNPAFEEYLATRPQHRIDYLGEQQELLKQAWERMLARTSQRDRDCQETLTRVLGPELAKSGKIYIYSSQALNFRTQAFAELRGRLAKAPNALYTFSQDFVSQTVCVVDEEVDKKKFAAEEVKKWLTPSGFKYPKPKTWKDLMTHPKRPSDIRIEDLKEPWQGDAPPPGREADVDVKTIQLEKGYNVRVRGGDLFGALKQPEYEHPFELKLVGDRNKLPRGLMLPQSNERDPAAFRSVHLGGEGQARIIAEAAAKEKADWAAKVIVDTNSFIVDGFLQKDKPSQTQRTDDILHSEPKRLFLKHLRTMKSHKGKDIHYETTPLSILSQGPYVQNAAANALVRATQKDKFITAIDAARRLNATAGSRLQGNNGNDTNTASSTSDFKASGSYIPTSNYYDTTSPTGKSSSAKAEAEPKDFVRFIHRDANATKIATVLSKHPIPPLDRNGPEVAGPKWVRPTASSSEGVGYKNAKD